MEGCFKRYTTGPGLSVYHRGADAGKWKSFAPLFDSAWDMEAIKVNKSRKVVVKYETGGKTYYVKIYSRRHASGIEHNLLRGSSLTFLRSKALKHLRKSQNLSAIGLSVVEPCMVIQRRYGFLRQESMLITPESTLPTLAERLHQKTGWESYLPAIGNAIRDISTMHENGYVQWDPHFHNMLVRPDQEIVWLDFGTIRKFRFSRKKPFTDIRKLWHKSINELQGRIKNPEKTVAELFERNYENKKRLHKALNFFWK